MNLPPLSPSTRIVKGKKTPKILVSKKMNKLPPLPKSSINLPPLSKRKKQTLSGIKDVDLKILSNLNDRDLFSLCIVDKYTNNLCKDKNFWRNRFINRFGENSYKPENRTWKNHYLKVVSDLDDYGERLGELTWNIKTNPDTYNVYLFDYQTENFINLEKDETSKNIYLFLALGKEITLELPLFPEDDFSIIQKYKSNEEFTPYKIFKLIHDFYQKNVTKEEIEKVFDDLGYEINLNQKRSDLLEDLIVLEKLYKTYDNISFHLDRIDDYEFN